MEAAVPECLWIWGKHRFSWSGLDETKSYKGAGDWIRQRFMRQSKTGVQCRDVSGTDMLCDHRQSFGLFGSWAPLH